MSFLLKGGVVLVIVLTIAILLVVYYRNVYSTVKKYDGLPLYFKEVNSFGEPFSIDRQISREEALKLEENNLAYWEAYFDEDEKLLYSMKRFGGKSEIMFMRLQPRYYKQFGTYTDPQATIDEIDIDQAKSLAEQGYAYYEVYVDKNRAVVLVKKHYRSEENIVFPRE